MNRSIFFALVPAIVAPLSVRSAETDGYQQVIRPFLKKYCMDCHNPEKQRGKLSLHDMQNVAQSKSTERWEKILEKLTLGEMPPKRALEPESAMRERVIHWIKSELHKVGKNVDEKFLLPGYANYLDHDKLFSAKGPTPIDVSGRLWRINPFVYSNRVSDITGDKTPTRPFNLKAGHGVRDYASMYKLDEPTTQMLLRAAKGIAAQQCTFTLEKGKLRGGRRTPKEILKIIEPQNANPTDEEIREVIIRQFHRVLQRDPTKQELTRFLEFTRKNFNEVDRIRGIRTTLTAVLLTPEALFRTEVGQGKPDKHGLVMLSPREIAFAIAYALTDEKPDGKLMEAAEKGRLSTKDEVKAQVQRLLNDPKTKKPRILRFFREYFEYPSAVDVFKEQKEFKHHRAQTLVNDTDQLIQYFIDKDKDILRELLTSNKSFVNHRKGRRGSERAEGGRQIHLSYSLPPDWKWTSEQPIEFPQEIRAGILTQPSWLVAFSDNFNNHAILRGKWIREKLLGGTVPDLPITVDAQLPNDDKLTLREKMEVTKQNYCWQCHQKMNPLGLPFEQYDHFGRWRGAELGKPVDTTGTIEDSGDERLEGPVSDPLSMLKKLANSDRVRQVFVRHAFRFWMGRNETLGDAWTLVQADKAYVENEGSLKALITSLLTSDSFLYRRKMASRSTR